VTENCLDIEDALNLKTWRLLRARSPRAALKTTKIHIFSFRRKNMSNF
jgi:hypothetical protein